MLHAKLFNNAEDKRNVNINVTSRATFFMLSKRPLSLLIAE